ncbi:hypothetical protein LQ757_10265 [Agromyces sp. SYSU K20354]|uniref:hypothetical protein n=1 Tax=Agromyces cavernae TaxID=2898659 RepID=UPI001E29C672|nr:hypothetical protein [Agromyces cavernae]MCD2442655.1 hypothetical protein [Agromyces cavernae]
MPRASRIGRFPVGAAIALVTIGLTGCAAPAGPAGVPDGITAELRQGRFDVEDRKLVVKVENAGPSAVEIERLAVTAPVFNAPLERGKPLDLSSGDSIDIRIDLPAPQCGTGEGRPLVELRGRSGDERFDGSIAPADPFGTLERIGATDCLTASVDAVAAITLPEHLRTTGDGAAQRAWIDVVITPEPTGDASFVVDVVHGTTLLGAEDGPEWPLALEVAAGGEPITVPLAVRPARCDAHAIADDKRGTILPFEVTTGDGLTGRIDRSSGDALQAELYDYVTERCGLGTVPVE